MSYKYVALRTALNKAIAELNYPHNSSSEFETATRELLRETRGLTDLIEILAERDADKARIEELTHNHRVHAAKLISERGLLKQRIAELESRKVKLPPLNDDLIAILGRPNFTCAHLAELMRKSGDDIRRKAEHEQAAVIHWFLDLYLEHGDKWEGVAKADIQSRVAAARITLETGERS